jgi:hypothetical protein
LNFKGTPSQEEQKTIFSGLKINKMAFSGESDATALFQQSAIFSVTLTLTFRSLSIPESQFSKTWQHKAFLRGKGDRGLSYSGIDEIPVSHLKETEESRKVNLIRQSHLTNL